MEMKETCVDVILGIINKVASGNPLRSVIYSQADMQHLTWRTEVLKLCNHRSVALWLGSTMNRC